VNKALELAKQIEALVKEQIQVLENPSPDVETISTVDALVKALSTGGSYKLADGDYKGNFVSSKPINLVAQSTNARLLNAVPTSPTLVVKTGGGSVFSGLWIQSGAPDRECVVVGDDAATSVDTQPDGVTFMNVVLQAQANGGHRGFALHGKNISLKTCQVLNFFELGRDSNGIWINNGPGPYIVDNCYVEASGEGIITGGSDVNIPNCVPADIRITNNTFFKPDSWRPVTNTKGVKVVFDKDGNLTPEALAAFPVVKNAMELKNAKRVLMEGNTADGCWRSGQDGNPIVLTVRNQYGRTPWAIVDDVIVRGNHTKRCKEGCALSILGYDNNYPSQQSQTMLIEHNLFEDSPLGFGISNGVATALSIRNNTLPKTTYVMMRLGDTRSDASKPPDWTKAVQSPITFVENIALSGSYGISGTDSTVGEPALNNYTDVQDWRGNVIEKTPERTIKWPNPATNWLLDPGGLAKILDPTTFKLLPGTPYGNAGY
jgi:hypothetical protein